MAGSAASMRSEMTERAVDVRGQITKLASLLLEDRLTALRKDDRFDLVIGQTNSIHAHLPVRFERSADSEEQEDAHCGEDCNARYESVHPSNHMLGVHNAEQK